MKIGEIKVGEIYAATNGKRYTYSGDLPRRVEALEIVTEEQQIWVGGGWSPSRGTRNVRRVKVRCLDEPRYPDYSWRHEAIMTAPKDTELVIEARFLAAKWSEVRREVKEKIDQDQAEADLKAATERRVEALLGKRLAEDARVRTGRGYRHRQKVRIEVEFADKALEEILALAEKGAGATES